MQIQKAFTILIVAAALVLTGCGDSGEKKTAGGDEPAKPEKGAEPENAEPEKAEAEKAEPEKAETKEVVELPPETPEEIEAQCKSLLKTYWTAIQPALAKLQIPDPASLEKEYTETGYDTRGFLKVCKLVGRADRQCLVDAKNPVAGPLTCNIDRKKTGGKNLVAPRVPGTSPLFEPAELAKGAGDAILARLAGTWRKKSPFGEETWTIDAKGKTVRQAKKRNGEIKKKSSLDDYTLSFTHVLRGARKYKSNGQTISFFMPDDTTFFAQGNMNMAAYDMKDGKTFLAKDSSNWVIVAGGKCEVVTFRGHVVAAKCGVADRAGQKYFDLEYQVPGVGHWKTRKPELTKASYAIVANHALAKQLFTKNRFVKQP